jgi:hypothetical protein
MSNNIDVLNRRADRLYQALPHEVPSRPSRVDYSVLSDDELDTLYNLIEQLYARTGVEPTWSMDLALLTEQERQTLDYFAAILNEHMEAKVHGQP